MLSDPFERRGGTMSSVNVQFETRGHELPQGASRWGFIGAGKMATAIIRGMLRNGTSIEAIVASDPNPSTRAALVGETGIATFDSNAEVVKNSDVIVLAVKPQMMAAVLLELRPLITPEHLVVSVAAGVSLATMANALGSDRRLVRAMPNTPSLVGEGAAAYCLGCAARDGDEAIVASCLMAIGKAFRVPESQLDAVTGLSGSGPAFVYVMIEALADGGVRAGLPREIAQTLAAQTVLGSAKMVLETGQHPGYLKDQVTSPAGTTIAGLHALERGGVRAALMDAVEAAYERSVELAALSAKAEKPA
jgi:pyrroline-5-carboxylate reductase